MKSAGIRENSFWVFYLVCVGILAWGIASRFSIPFVWDDAYFFARYADHWLTDGKIAWDPGGEPTYGPTSLLFLLIVTPLRWLVRDNPALPVASASFLCGLAFLILLFTLVTRNSSDRPWVKRIALGVVLLSLANSIDQLATHFNNGMDTTFAMAYLTLYLLLLKWHERALAFTSAIIVGIYGGLSFWVRPDMLLYTALVPACIFFFDQNPQSRRGARIIITLTFLLTVGQVLFNQFYFKSPLPLSFYAKGLQLYGDNIRSVYALTSLIQFATFFASKALLFFLIGVDVSWDFKAWQSGTPASDKGILLATIFFYCVLFIFCSPDYGCPSAFLLSGIPCHFVPRCAKYRPATYAIIPRDSPGHP